MAVTSLTAARSGNTTTVTAVSSFGGAAYFHWYMDGAWVGMTRSGVRVFELEAADQVRIEAVDTIDVDFDPVANAPAGWPSRRTLYWVRSTDTDVDHYRVEQQRAGGAWTVLARVAANEQWQYHYLTPRLDDLTVYAWRVTPVDRNGNDGTTVTLDSLTVVRTPNGVTYTATFNPGTLRVTFAAA